MSVFADLDNILRACPAEYLAEEYGPDATVESIAERLVEGIRTVALEHASDALAREADALWAPGRTAHTVMLADAAWLRSLVGLREKPAPTLPPSYRAQQLLAHIQDDPGTRWQTGRAEQVYADLGYPARGRRHNARGDLNDLAARGLLKAHGPADGRYFLLVQPKDGA
ncbi:hypothetical protein [Streptomyces rubiginosohelvolus]|uniref:hypothetical protein n=1 Tax=Streptomyces rubiginosohelvolus TaxID=67362 RepID=UPI0033BDA27A